MNVLEVSGGGEDFIIVRPMPPSVYQRVRSWDFDG
jgi:hypothetical protein